MPDSASIWAHEKQALQARIQFLEAERRCIYDDRLLRAKIRASLRKDSVCAVCGFGQRCDGDQNPSAVVSLQL